MNRLVERVHPATIQKHPEIAEWVEKKAAQGLPPQDRKDEMLTDLQDRFEGKFREESRLRFLIHVARPEISPANASLMGNLIDGLRFLGLETRALLWDEPVEPVLSAFHPTILLTSGDHHFLSKIDWEAVGSYRKTHPLLIGLGASPEERFEADVIDDVLDWSVSHDVSFFYKWTPHEYENDRRYDRYKDRGFPLLTVEFGANPLLYQPVGEDERDLEYVFIGSAHDDKAERYVRFFGPILRNHPGFLLGPGWPTGPPFHMPREPQSFLYGRAKAALNLHIPKQLKNPLQLNERFYNLACAGVPQVVDDPPLIKLRFTDEAFFSASTPRQFLSAFQEVLDDPNEARRRAMIGRQQVLSKYTVFHIADKLAEDVLDVLVRSS